MKPTPFPFLLNIGTDIVHIPRIQRLVTHSVVNSSQRTYLSRFVRRILCKQEQAVFESKFQLAASVSNAALPAQPITPQKCTDIARWLAGRFAAKEAARKAAPGGASSISWKEVVVRAEAGGDGRPEVVYLREGDSVGQVGKLSISHDGEYVVATVIAASPQA
ncbi:putative holo-[acyl-carrier-protein] synthase [Microsporum canis]|uniref:4'-phosphopantetheinyl transferase superfamily protein n=1 Tax=Arthroderma otae (strain ATCC MYA-4605 / CBS 113480) TaxID=554155 RepID=C5FTE6_ARTOC|nr:4'-phosphopantetheinyl transferase superfamily protein [Microsporum canis CBS 113480]EEQ33149.1 4'-phosphopantetheinyl transferase superfamily protein [Microsporum canis CBS 113480]